MSPVQHPRSMSSVSMQKADPERSRGPSAFRRLLPESNALRVALIVAGALALFGSGAAVGFLATDGGPTAALPGTYRAQVFRADDCPQDPLGDRFVGFDNLLTLMGSQGVDFYRSPTPGPLAGPEGIIANTDLVILKINYQWEERGGSNTDLLRGLIRAIVDHPDGFAGEIVVAENVQFVGSTSNFDRTANNAQDTTLSPHDVVVHFQGLGFDVSHYDWTLIRGDEVDEYSDGDMNDGYVLYTFDPLLNGRLSYPKFQTDGGVYVSLRDGIWDPGSSTYSREGLKFLNLPVLKSHHAAYGVTAAVKNYMGVVTGSHGTGSHNAVRHGLLGGLLGEIQPPDLTILDAIWINANPFSGPATAYGEATRRDQLVASTDPVAADIWATKTILIPAFLDNGFSPPWPSPSADPDDPASAFREYLDNSMNAILDAGYEVTNDLTRIDAFVWDGVSTLPLFADGFESGDTSRWSLTLP